MEPPSAPFRALPGAGFRQGLEAAAAALLAFSAAFGFTSGTPPAGATPREDPLWIVVDVSGSMLAGAPRRLDLARLGLDSWLESLGPVPARPTGLVVFAAHARVVVAPARDTLLVRSQVARLATLALAPDLAPGPEDPSGTDLASGIALARSWPGTGDIWLLTDGDDPVRRSAPPGSPLADRAWVIGAPGRGEPVPGRPPEAISTPCPDRVSQVTRGQVIESGDAPPALPELPRAWAPLGPSPVALAMSLAALVVLFSSAVPTRWIAFSLVAVSGCAGHGPAEPGHHAMAQWAKARAAPTGEQGPALRSAENALRLALATSNDSTLLEALVVCLLDQAPHDPRAPRLAAEIATGLPPGRAEPLRARARWLEALQASGHQQGTGGRPGGDSTPGSLDDGDGGPGTSRWRQPRPGLPGGTPTPDALPGAGRLPLVADTAQPQSLTRLEAARLVAAGSSRLPPPAPPRRPTPGRGVPDW